MAVATKSDLLSRANTIRQSIAGFSVRASYVGALFRDLVDSLSGAAGRFDVTSYATNATNLQNGVEDPTAAFAAANTAAAAVGGTVYVPAGTYGTGSDWTFALSSGVKLEGDGDASVLVKCHLSMTGTAGSEINFSSAAAKGDTSLALASSVTAGDWLRLVSCINSQSTDAGIEQLGHDTPAASFLAEFARVTTGGTSPGLAGPVRFPYSNTPGGDSGSRTVSTARVMAFHEGSRVRRLKFSGINSTKTQIILGTFCRDCVVEDVTVDANDETAQLIRFLYSMDCDSIDCRYVGKRTSIPTSTLANPVSFISSTRCRLVDSRISYGNQGFDIDCAYQDATYFGGPSIDCGAYNSKATDCASDGFTSHYGNWGSSFVCLTTRGCPTGVRVRDRKAYVSGCRGYWGSTASGQAILIDNAASMECTVVDNPDLDTFLYGIRRDYSAAGYTTLEGLLSGTGVLISNNSIANCVNAVLLDTAPTSANMRPALVRGNISRNCSDDNILIASYNNGVIAEGNHCFGLASGKAAVRWQNNCKRLYIGPGFAYGNSGAFAVRGPGVGTGAGTEFLTDATTFPSQDSEAQLYIDPRQHTDVSSPFTGILRFFAAYKQLAAPGWVPFASSLNNVAPTLERSSFGEYFTTNGSVNVKATDSAGTQRTFISILTGSGTPEAAVTASVGEFLYLDTVTAILYAKTSGTGNTGWVKVSAT